MENIGDKLNLIYKWNRFFLETFIKFYKKLFKIVHTKPEFKQSNFLNFWIDTI